MKLVLYVYDKLLFFPQVASFDKSKLQPVATSERNPVLDQMKQLHEVSTPSSSNVIVNFSVDIGGGFR